METLKTAGWIAAWYVVGVPLMMLLMAVPLLGTLLILTWLFA